MSLFFKSEIILTRQLNHPNIVRYHVAFVSGPEVCVVSPLMAYGSCRDLITRHFNEGKSVLSRSTLFVSSFMLRYAYFTKFSDKCFFI